MPDNINNQVAKDVEFLEHYGKDYYPKKIALKLIDDNMDIVKAYSQTLDKKHFDRLVVMFKNYGMTCEAMGIAKKEPLPTYFVNTLIANGIRKHVYLPNGDRVYRKKSLFFRPAQAVQKLLHEIIYILEGKLLKKVDQFLSDRLPL